MVPVTKEYVGGKFFTRVDGVLMATPLLTVLLLVVGIITFSRVEKTFMDSV
jgi:tellurite resistance protein TerC